MGKKYDMDYDSIRFAGFGGVTVEEVGKLIRGEIKMDRYPTRKVGSAQMVVRNWELEDRPDRGKAMPALWDTVRSFYKNGYCVIPGLYDPSECEEMKTWSQKMALDRSYHIVGRDMDGRYSEDELPLEWDGKSIRSMFGVHAQAGDYIEQTPFDVIIPKQKTMLNLINALLGPCYTVQSRVNFKTSMIGGGFDWHSDFETWHARDGMPLPKAVSAIVCLDDNNRDNGCLEVLSGSHEFVLLSGENDVTHQYGIPEKKFLELLSPRHTYVEAPRGSLILFDCNLMHASGPNRTVGDRTNFYAIFNAMDNLLMDPFVGETPRAGLMANRSQIPKPVNRFSL